MIRSSSFRPPRYPPLVSAGGCSVEGDPALIVWLVDTGSMLHQKSHHVHIIIYACLGEDKEKGGLRPGKEARGTVGLCGGVLLRMVGRATGVEAGERGSMDEKTLPQRV
ncbi:unnamed protein product [Lampetra planeri]